MTNTSSKFAAVAAALLLTVVTFQQALAVPAAARVAPVAVLLV